MQFIGNNDKSTLVGAAEEVEREVKTYEHRARTERLQRDRYAAEKVAGVLRSLAYDFRMAAENGPVPDFSKLRLTMSMPDQVAMLTSDCHQLAAKLYGVTWEIVEDDTDRTMPTTYRVKVGACVRAVKYIDRIAALGGLRGELQEALTKQDADGIPRP